MTNSSRASYSDSLFPHVLVYSISLSIIALAAVYLVSSLSLG